MARLALRKVKGTRIGFVPANRAAEVEAEKLPTGRILKADITNPRNVKFQGLMFAAFTLLADILNSGPGRRDWDQNSVRRRLLIVTGHADTFTVPATLARSYGLPEALPVIGFEPRSMAFDSMDQDEASRFFDKAMAYVLSEFGDWTRTHEAWAEIEAIGATLRLHQPAERKSA